jgi:hypothetical protein
MADAVAQFARGEVPEPGNLPQDGGRCAHSRLVRSGCIAQRAHHHCFLYLFRAPSRLGTRQIWLAIYEIKSRNRDHRNGVRWSICAATLSSRTRPQWVKTRIPLRQSYVGFGRLRTLRLARGGVFAVRLTRRCLRRRKGVQPSPTALPLAPQTTCRLAPPGCRARPGALQ